MCTMAVSWLFIYIFFALKSPGKARGIFNCAFVTKINQLLSVGVIFILNSGDTCVGAKPTPEIYSTRNILLSSESVFIVEFSLKCDNNAKVQEGM